MLAAGACLAAMRGAICLAPAAVAAMRFSRTITILSRRAHTGAYHPYIRRLYATQRAKLFDDLSAESPFGISELSALETKFSRIGTKDADVCQLSTHEEF
jgi:hypothetical protein